RPRSVRIRPSSRPTSASRWTTRPRGWPMLTAEALVTTYGAVRALDGVSVTVDAGTITAVLGANGAGKTTLLRTINGLVRPASGRMTYDGEDLIKTRVEDVVALGVAQVPGGGGVVTLLPVLDDLQLGA